MVCIGEITWNVFYYYRVIKIYLFTTLQLNVQGYLTRQDFQHFQNVSRFKLLVYIINRHKNLIKLNKIENDQNKILCEFNLSNNIELHHDIVYRVWIAGSEYLY